MGKRTSTGKTIFKIACATGGAVLASGVGLPWLGAMAGSCLPKVLEGSLGFLVSAVEDDKKQEVLASLLQKPIEQLASLGIEFTGGRIDDFFKSHFEAKESELNFDLPRAVVKVWEEALNKLLRAKRDDSILGLNRNDEFEKARKELLTFWQQKLHKAQFDNDLLKEFFGEKPDYFLDVEKGIVSFIEALPDQEQIESFFWNRIEESFTNWAKKEEKFPEDWTNSIHQNLKDELKQNLFHNFSSALKKELKENERAWKSFEFASSLQTVSMLQSLASNTDQIKDDTSNIKKDLAELNNVLPLIMRDILTRFDALENTVKEFFTSNQNINGLLIDFRKDVSEKLSEIGKDVSETKDFAKQAAENTGKLLNQIVIVDITNPNINIPQILSISAYQDLEKRLERAKKYFSRLGEDETVERDETNEEIIGLEEEIKQRKQIILQLAETIQNDNSNSARLQHARELLSHGKLTETITFFEDESPKMRNELDYLLNKTEIINEARKNLASDYLIAALTSQFDFENPNHFERTCENFKASIESFPTVDSLFKYAYFLNQYKQEELSKKYYQRILDDFGEKLSSSEKTTVLYNLGKHYSTPEEYEEAISELQVLIANHKKNAKNEYDVLPVSTAEALFNLGNFHIRQDKVKEAIYEYKESLLVYRKNAETNPNYYLPRIAEVLMTLGKLYIQEKERAKAIKELSEASEIYSKLSSKNTKAFLEDLRDTHYLRGACFVSNCDYEKSIQDNLKASEITKQLDTNDSWRNLIIIADSLEQIDFCQYKQGFKPNEEYLLEAISLRTKLVKETSEIYFEKVVQSTLRLWGFYQEQNRYQDAIKLTEKSLALARDLKDKESSINCLGTTEIILSLISTRLVVGEVEQGLKEALKGREILFSLKESTDLIGLPFQMRFLLTLGFLYVENKQIEQAIEVAVECLLTASFMENFDTEWQQLAKDSGVLFALCGLTQEMLSLTIEGIAIMRGANSQQIRAIQKWAKSLVKNE